MGNDPARPSFFYAFVHYMVTILVPGPGCLCRGDSGGPVLIIKPEHLDPLEKFSEFFSLFFQAGAVEDPFVA